MKLGASNKFLSEPNADKVNDDSSSKVFENLKKPTCDQVCSLDFILDQLSDARRFPLLNVMDDYKRKGLDIGAGFSLQ